MRPNPFLTDLDAALLLGALQLIGARCSELESGARVVDAILTNTVLPAISQEYLTRMKAGEPLSSIRISVKDGEFNYQFE
jgi:type VI secretion system protein VasG